MKKMWGNVSVRRKCELTSSDLEWLFNHFDTSKHDDTLFLMITLMGFHALLWLGEMTQPDSQEKSTSRKLSSQHTLCLHTQHFTYLLLFHKGDRFFDGNMVLVSSQPTSRMCPLQMMHHYLASRDSIFGLFPELWLTSDGCIPSCLWFVTKICSVLGSDVAGHSLRSGGATALALERVADDHIQAAGWWALDSFRVYI